MLFSIVCLFSLSLLCTYFFTMYLCICKKTIHLSRLCANLNTLELTIKSTYCSRMYVSYVCLFCGGDIHVTKQTYMREKRHICEKRDIHARKETYMREKRHTCEKREVHIVLSCMSLKLCMSLKYVSFVEVSFLVHTSFLTHLHICSASGPTTNSTCAPIHMVTPEITTQIN